MADYLKRILTARVYDVAKATPLQAAERLSARVDNRVLLKREDMQPVFSFKLRGAYNKIVNLKPEQRERGVICASAGNHAQGVALAASKLNCHATIVMPRTTPSIKVQAVRDLGGKVVLHGDTYDDAYEHAVELGKRDGLTFVHPYDDPDVIAGQGTIAREILLDHPDDIHAIFVPVGGGGLIAGIAAYVKAVRPDIRIIGVESDESACMAAALDKGRRVKLPQIGIFADGVAVRQAGKETFRVAKQYVDDMITVSVDETCAAIRDLFEDTRSIPEPAGALAVAGIKQYVQRWGIHDCSLVAIESGANMNFDRLRHVAERAQVGERAEALLAVTIPEQPGSFKQFCRDIGKRNITEFNYRYAHDQRAHVFAGVALENGEAEKQQLLSELEAAGYEYVDLTDDELAKVHVRYMVGGRAPQVTDERLYRFEFPERPGALAQFLQRVGSNWNISLFHYRNHGAAYGRVLVGLQVPAKERVRFEKSLKKLGYVYSEESGNAAYERFLS